MKKKLLFSVTGAAVLAFSAVSNLSAAELLTNGSFESPLQTTTGDHIHVQPDGWTVADNPYTNTSVSGDCNIVNGTVTGAGASTPISPYDGVQAFDGDGGNFYVSETITLSSASALHIQLAIGGRDGNSATGTGSFYQLGTVTSTNGTPSGFSPLLTSATVNPATGSFIFLQQNTQVFAAGTYRFTVFLGDPDHLDAVSITTVPEPTTLAAAGLGACLLGWVGFKRRRRA